MNSGDLIARGIYALQSADDCGACHNPGRSQLPVEQRRCTLDCQGCHIDPSGAGPRNSWGYYYNHARLAAIQVLDPIDPLQDQSRFDVHMDQRQVGRMANGEVHRFPMQAEFSLRIRPFVDHLHFTYQANYFGQSRSTAHPVQQRQYLSRYSLMLDGLWFNTYLKAFQGIPVYGIRRSNHTRWIRERNGLGIYAHTRGVAIGGTPNVPYMHASYMVGDPTASAEDKQEGVSAHGGLRGVSYAWHINSSYWKTESVKNKIDMNALGIGAKVWPFILAAERNVRVVLDKEVGLREQIQFSSQASRVYPSAVTEEVEIVLAPAAPWMFGVLQEIYQSSSISSKRLSGYIDFNPLPYLQFEVWRRHETGTRDFWDTILVAHLYLDL